MHGNMSWKQHYLNAQPSIKYLYFNYAATESEKFTSRCKKSNRNSTKDNTSELGWPIFEQSIIKNVQNLKPRNTRFLWTLPRRNISLFYESIHVEASNINISSSYIFFFLRQAHPTVKSQEERMSSFFIVDILIGPIIQLACQ